MTEPEESLTLRRPKRSTAGNRMEAALLQISMEEENPDFEDDTDFVGPVDEDEVFDSDFQSTDDEAVAQEEEGTGEKEIQEEEKKAVRTVRLRAAKATTVALNRQGAGSKRPPKPKTLKRNKHVSLGVAIDAETGEAVHSSAHRKSRRKSTILAAQSLHSRLKDAEVKKASMPKRVKEVTRMLSQAELIARALDTEEGNIMEHRNYLSLEEEKRKRARVVRKFVSGPLLRWTSRTEEEKLLVESFPSYPMVSGLSANGPSSYSSASQSQGPSSAGPSTLSGIGNPPGMSAASNLFVQPLLDPPIGSNGVGQNSEEQLTQPIERNYVVIEKDQSDFVGKPQWEETMAALFGDHVKWGEVKMYSGKQRPIARPIVKCPVTGRPALYRDPRTGVPYANVRAYRTLSRLLNHEFHWHDGLGCYTADDMCLQPDVTGT